MEAPLSEPMLAGQVALVTGATGIADAATRALAAAGARLVLLGRKLPELQAFAAGLPGEVLTLRADITDPAETEAAVAAALEFGGGRIDILLNGAGMQGPHMLPFWEVPAAEFDRTIDTNLLGPFLLMRAVLPGMIARRSGRIINIGGTFGLKGVRHRAHYSASKWGLRGLARSAALDAGEFGITVNTICPGYVRSASATREFEEESRLTGRSIAAIEADANRLMALRRFVEPADIAAAVLLLAGPDGANITGQEIVIDAGAVV